MLGGGVVGRHAADPALAKGLSMHEGAALRAGGRPDFAQLPFTDLATVLA